MKLFRPNQKQLQAFKLLSDERFTRYLFDGGSRSGKTAATIVFLVDRAFHYPGSRQLVARKHLAHARTSLWSGTLRDYLANHVPPHAYQMRDSQLYVGFHNRSEIWLGGLDDKERLEKILGNEYLTVFVNEATQISYEAAQMVMTRLSQNCRHHATGALGVQKLVLDCNPRGPRHWLHRYGVQKIDPETHQPLKNADKLCRLNWSAFDNKENLSPAYLETLESLPEVIRDRMLHGVWRDNEGAVYDEFDEELHVLEPFEIPLDWRRLRSVDFGYVNPFVCLWAAVDHDGRVYVYRERYLARVRITEHARVILELSAGERIELTVADHDAGERAELEAGGVPTLAARKDIAAGLQAVKERFAVQPDGQPRLFLFKACANTIGELYDYRWDDARDGAAAERPRKEHDHAMDALRYLVMAVDSGRSGPPKFDSGSIGGRRWN